MHKWLISVCFFLINLNFVSPRPTTVKTLSLPFDLNHFHPPDALGCSCVQSDNQIVKKFNFEQYSSCGFQSGDPWPYCITTDKGDCPFKRQTSIPNVFYIPCERHHVAMNQTCIGKTCHQCANFDQLGRRQIISRTYESSDYEACDSKCLNSDSCKFTSFSGAPLLECALFSHCTTRNREPTDFLRHKITVKTNFEEADPPVQDPTPHSYRQDDSDGLNDCYCRGDWIPDPSWGDCPSQSVAGCADEKCLGGNWCQVANPPCKNQFTQDKIAWTKCTNETQIEPVQGCKCKARWGLPHVLGKECVGQSGCSFSEKCGANEGFGLCEVEREGCTLKANVMPCGKSTPVATLQPEDKPECKCKEEWESIVTDAKCVNQHGCATTDCADGNWAEALNVPTEDFPTAENSEYITLWCVVQDAGCRTAVNIPGSMPFAPCITEKPKEPDQDSCRSSKPDYIPFELRYDVHGHTLSTTAVAWNHERIMHGSISFQNLGGGGMVLFSTDASEATFTTKQEIFSAPHSYIRCPEEQECKGRYHVNIKSEMGFQVIYLRFISVKKLTGDPDARRRYMVQSEKIVKCKSDSSTHTHIGFDKFDDTQSDWLNTFYTTKVPVATPSFGPGETTTGDVPILNWEYLWQVLLIGILAFIIFLLFLGIHNLDSCCDSLAEHMFEASTGDSILAPGEYQSQQFTEELLLGHHETGEDPICLSEQTYEPGNWDDFENPEQVTVQMEDENEI